jgi:hypothetical protein
VGRAVHQVQDIHLRSRKRIREDAITIHPNKKHFNQKHSKMKTTYTFDQYVQLCSTVDSFHAMEILCELLSVECKLFKEEEMLYLLDLTSNRLNVIMKKNDN